MLLADQMSVGDLVGFLVITGGSVAFLVWRVIDDRRADARRDAEQAERDAERQAEHERQMAELAEQKRLRELDDLRAGLLRGREKSCRFCGLENGVLSLQEVCLDVDECFSRAGVPAEI